MCVCVGETKKERKLRDYMSEFTCLKIPRHLDELNNLTMALKRYSNCRCKKRTKISIKKFKIKKLRPNKL